MTVTPGSPGNDPGIVGNVGTPPTATNPFGNSFVQTPVNGTPGSSSGAHPAPPFYVPPGQQTQIGNTTPPPERTLVYSPDVRILVAHNGQQIDVSNDLVRGTLIRKENAASTLLWTCHNKGLRYTNGGLGNQPLLSRMDRVTCYMKRAGNWVQTFSGYLDSIPYLQLYPGLVDFKATCTLKRLLCSWWNPGLPESASLLNQYANETQETAGDGQVTLDVGMGSMLRDILIKVGGWAPQNVHIQNFPQGFLDLLDAQEKQQPANNQQATNFRQMLEGNVSTPAPGQMAGYNSSAGPPGPAGSPGLAGAGPVGSGTMFYVGEIIAATDLAGMGPNVQDQNLARGLQTVSTTGEGSRDNATKEAFQQTQNVATYYAASTRNTDAAIIATATAMWESTNGPAIRNLYNPARPDSQQYKNDGPGYDTRACGIFQQEDNGAWGTTAEQMNPRQAASMFLAALNKFDWKNMDPGVVAYDVQQALNPSTYSAGVDGLIPAATTAVQTLRKTQAGATSSVVPAVSNPLSNVASSTAPALGIGGTGATNTPGATPVVPVSTGSLVGKPNPDSEGAINWAITQLGKPYHYGAAGPDSWDCSSLLQGAFRSIGREIGRDTWHQQTSGIPISPSAIKRGDALQCEGGDHTMLWLGDGTIIEASTDGVPVHRVNAYVQPAQAFGIYRYADNGGPDPSAPFDHTASPGPGNPPYTGYSTTTGAAAGATQEGIAQNLFAYIFDPSRFLTYTSQMYASVPEKDFIDAQPLIQMVQSISGACLRNFASAPNGDFIAYYPDFFGMDGKPAVFTLEDIELKDLTMNFSDDALATHVYVNAADTPQGLENQTMGWLKSLGYATVENTLLYQRMRLVAPGDLENMSGQDLMKRFGVRPLQVTYGTVMAGGGLDFLMAVRIFMTKWAEQYQSSIAMTFMPDLFPSMRVQLSGHNIQFYVSEVTHHFDFEQGFTTSVVATAPSNPNVRNLWPTSNSQVPPVQGGLGSIVNAAADALTAGLAAAVSLASDIAAPG
jgi:cell wall-associated NlpC family hydrolase